MLSLSLSIMMSLSLLLYFHTLPLLQTYKVKQGETVTFISLATQVNVTTPLNVCVCTGNEVCPCVRMCEWICASARPFWIRAQYWDVKLPWQPNTQRHTTSPWHHDYFATTICTNKTTPPQINVCGFDRRSSVQKREGPSGFSFSLLLGAIWRQQEVGETKQGCRQIFSHLKFFLLSQSGSKLLCCFFPWYILPLYKHVFLVSQAAKRHTHAEAVWCSGNHYITLSLRLIFCCYILRNITYLSSIN